jgi:hypothetical protein
VLSEECARLQALTTAPGQGPALSSTAAAAAAIPESKRIDLSASGPVDLKTPPSPARSPLIATGVLSRTGSSASIDLDADLPQLIAPPASGLARTIEMAVRRTSDPAAGTAAAAAVANGTDPTAPYVVIARTR